MKRKLRSDSAERRAIERAIYLLRVVAFSDMVQEDAVARWDEAERWPVPSGGCQGRHQRPWHPSDPTPEEVRAKSQLLSLITFAYDNGFHELGHDPIDTYAHAEAIKRYPRALTPPEPTE